LHKLIEPTKDITNLLSRNKTSERQQQLHKTFARTSKRLQQSSIGLATLPTKLNLQKLQEMSQRR